MFKRLPVLLAAVALAACSSHQGDSSDTSAPATPATTTQQAAATPAPASSAAKAPASASTASTNSAPATDSSSASAAQNDAQASTSPAPKKPAQPFHDNGKWVEGTNYYLIQPQQPVIEQGKINVTEVFSYGCPACYHAHSTVDQMAKSLPDGAVMTYLPAAFRPDENWPVYQRAYYAAKALGVADKTYDAMFDAIWKDGSVGSYNLATGTLKPKSEWPDINKIATFYTKYGIKKSDFVGVANSFSVNLKMKRADELVKAYGVQGTPSFIVDGKYRFDIQSAGGYAQAVELAQYLVRKEAAGQ
ncbi:thiol:disulfide interchange protein DsbA/DsbL [Oleiagrimonas sp. C23AA]|uniref:thiol:disulfide interchange protein DsbA/DsbL n=1 Tax=Oleiagrimonas sp. C23AA TaxID=2719047 RepID=UPI0014214511|nr:thiol:disulfide interchange protein DsbA/DsbL [Oleiagrimonas sp. C23AA]NII11400.1 thiol:disulfide interchange protein DsbA/DsbL [Oleiagrimonas sp. C23AA]